VSLESTEVSEFLHAPSRWPIEKVAKEMAQALISGDAAQRTVKE
jgi:hypothetical protein